MSDVWEATAGEDLNNDQTAAATGARLWEDVAVGSVDVLGGGGFGLRSWDVEQLPRSREVVLALALGEETVVTDAMETGREHVDEKAADELAGSERHHLDACGSVDAVVLPLEGDAVVDGDEAAVGDGDAMPVAEQMKFYDAWGSAATYPHVAVPWAWAPAPP